MTSQVEIIARLGHACGLPWARCRCSRLLCVHGLCARWHRGSEEQPLSLEAWQAEWEREHPGKPGPCDMWLSLDGTRRWEVIELTTGVVSVKIEPGTLTATWCGEGWRVDTDPDVDATAAHVAELARLIAAVEGT